MDKLFVVEVYSPFVKKYIVSEEWPDKPRAMAGLKAEMKAHQRLVATLEEAVKQGPTASVKAALKPVSQRTK